MTSEKIGAQHLARKAVLYVRQSSAHHVLHNRDHLTSSVALVVAILQARVLGDHRRVRWSRFVGLAGGFSKVYSAVFSPRQNLYLF